LLDRLILICSRTIIRHCNVYNAASLACEAGFYRADELRSSVFDYIIASLETMLESGLLDDMDDDTLASLGKAMTAAQLDKLRIPRSQQLVKAAMDKHKDWLAMQDIPAPRVRQPWRWKNSVIKSPTLAPVGARSARRRGTPSPFGSPEVHASLGGAVDDIFAMDDEPMTPPTPMGRDSGRTTPRAGAGARPMTPLDLSAPPALAGRAGGGGGGAVWRSSAVEAQRVDLRSIMAEAAAVRTPARPTPAASGQPVGRAGGQSPVSTPSKMPGMAGMARSPPSAGGPAWRPVDGRKTSFASVQAQQGGPSAPARSPGMASGSGVPSQSPVPQRMPSGSRVTPKAAAPPLGAQRKSS
jgi:hypothetical protein